MGSGGDSADPRVQFWLTRTFVLRPSIRCLLSGRWWRGLRWRRRSAAGGGPCGGWRRSGVSRWPSSPWLFASPWRTPDSNPLPPILVGSSYSFPVNFSRKDASSGDGRALDHHRALAFSQSPGCRSRRGGRSCTIRCRGIWRSTARPSSGEERRRSPSPCRISSA